MDWEKGDLTIDGATVESRIYRNLLIVEKFDLLYDFDEQLEKARERGHYDEGYEGPLEPLIRNLYIDEYAEP